MVEVPQFWEEVNNSLVRNYEFGDFLEAMEFVNRVGYYSEKQKHHPEIEVRYNKVKLILKTHEAGAITDKDVKLAQTINDFDKFEEDEKTDDEGKGKGRKKKADADEL